ncbi:MAG: DUF2059 domain-containing protein [Paracoccaceae bacterium]
MRKALIALITVSLTCIGSAQADTGSLIERYYAALKLDKVFEILRSEGIEAGEEMTEDGSVSTSPAWTRRLEGIYAIDKMEAAFRYGLESAGDLQEAEAALAFFESPLGARIVEIELEARGALNDTDLEEEVRTRVEKMRADKDARIGLYETFVEVNNLIDSNVMGALNANLAFYQGMATTPSFEDGLPEEFMLSTIWDQEPEIRDNMKDWTMNFSALAYSTLSEDEMQDYIDISRTSAGQKLNSALFSGFDQMFEMQSFELGRATAEFMMGDET